MTVNEILSEFRSIPVPNPVTHNYRHLRMKAMKEVRQLTGMKLEAIGELFGTHHTTVLYACDEQFRDKRRLLARLAFSVKNRSQRTRGESAHGKEQSRAA